MSYTSWERKTTYFPWGVGLPKVAILWVENSFLSLNKAILLQTES
jgi:hypothetical protein